MNRVTVSFPVRKLDNRGFSIIELVLACIILPIVVISASSAYNSIHYSYTTARKLNEVYSVLSACPELDRALEFSSLATSTNCYPNNSFAAENGGPGTITYLPNLTVTDTASLPSGDPLKPVPDSKITSITVSYPGSGSSRPPLQLRMLITRNGIGQQ
jgi:hypothetical protein